MNIPERFAAEFEAFPPALKALVEAELAAGNEITELAGGFPAPPVGACLRLARQVTTRPRSSDETLHFYPRNTSLYSGEFTDAERLFFVLEPPLPPPPEPDSNAIPNTMPSPPPSPRKEVRGEEGEPGEAGSSASAHPPQSAVGLFQQSMVMTYERWHDGTGYDLDLLETASAEERAEIEALLLNRAVEDWRDVEALAALNTPAARSHLRQALAQGNPRIATAIARHAPSLVSDPERTATLVAALENTRTFNGLSQTLDLVAEFHPPEVVDALWRGLLSSDGETAVHFAAMLYYVYGKADEAFDWNHRPFYLSFKTDDPKQRRQQFNELCRRVELDPAALLARIT